MNSGVSMTAVFLLTCVSGAAAQPSAIDTARSVMTVHVYRAGALAAFGHDHEIAVPIASGSVDFAAHQVELRMDAKALSVQDPDASEKDRGEVQKTMLGPEVLDVEHYPAIVFRSTLIEPARVASWRIPGTLMLHGATHPVMVEVAQKDGHYTGHALIKQTDFGVTPVRAAGGAVRVKDEVRIDFDIQLAHGKRPA
jgi:polyisoprenoid-binding protein YceI